MENKGEDIFFCLLFWASFERWISSIQNREKRELRESTDRKSKTTVKRSENVRENKDTLGPSGPLEKGTNNKKVVHVPAW